MSVPGGRPAWETVRLARHPDRPYALDYVRALGEELYELHGDRLTADDPALVGALARWRGRRVMFLGQQKGRSLRERAARNFGMLHPEGYRKAVRLARLAARFRVPVVCLVDTPGAYPGAEAEERGIGSAIGMAIVEWFRLRTPVVAAVIGEGGSGGALGLAVADRVLMLEHAIYSVAGPEACASILWRDPARREEAAEQLGLTAPYLLAAGLVDEVVPEPPGGAHMDPARAARLLDGALGRHLDELLETDPDQLVRRRYDRFRAVDYGTEPIPTGGTSK
ncbi:MAG: acetyl-CoA carboxylase carboxyltransferase subunit alpha [Chloroflexi bacterium]|nr:MAG: acetyl-CoA carboxylase carboxyltransferase subunit alpha [Chloroflexota bacterium]